MEICSDLLWLSFGYSVKQPARLLLVLSFVSMCSDVATCAFQSLNKLEALGGQLRLPQ